MNLAFETRTLGGLDVQYSQIDTDLPNGSRVRRIDAKTGDRYAVVTLSLPTNDSIMGEAITRLIQSLRKPAS